MSAHPVRARLWAQTLASALAAALAAVTLLWPDWIEEVFGVRPDGGSGALEWFSVAALTAVAVALGVAAGRGWRRVATAS